jgi:hypothetical protein
MAVIFMALARWSGGIHSESSTTCIYDNTIRTYNNLKNEVTMIVASIGLPYLSALSSNLFILNSPDVVRDLQLSM